MILAQFTWRMRSLSLPDLFVLPTKKSLPGILRTEPWRCHFSPPWLCRNNSGLQGTEEGPRFRASRYRWNLVVVGVPRRPNGLGGSHGPWGWWLMVEGPLLEVDDSDGKLWRLKGWEICHDSVGCLPFWSYFNQSRLREFHELFIYFHIISLCVGVPASFFMVWCSTHTSSRPT